jgi:hypothetical protein
MALLLRSSYIYEQHGCFTHAEMEVVTFMSNMVGSHTLKWLAPATAKAWIGCFLVHTALSSLVTRQLFGSYWR